MESLHISLDLHFQRRIDFYQEFPPSCFTNPGGNYLPSTPFNYSSFAFLLFLSFFSPFPSFFFCSFFHDPELHLLQELKDILGSAWQISLLRPSLLGRVESISLPLCSDRAQINLNLPSPDKIRKIRSPFTQLKVHPFPEGCWRYSLFYFL